MEQRILLYAVLNVLLLEVLFTDVLPAVLSVGEWAGGTERNNDVRTCSNEVIRRADSQCRVCSGLGIGDVGFQHLIQYSVAHHQGNLCRKLDEFVTKGHTPHINILNDTCTVTR